MFIVRARSGASVSPPGPVLAPAAVGLGPGARSQGSPRILLDSLQPALGGLRIQLDRTPAPLVPVARARVGTGGGLRLLLVLSLQLGGGLPRLRL